MYNWEQLNKANDDIKTVDIRGKKYAEVSQRIKAFRKVCPQGCIQTEMLDNANGVCVFKATVLNEDGKVLGTGTAYEKEGNGNINKLSYIENCETSAVGRALGMCGFGVDVAVASAEEMANATELKKDKPRELTPREKLIAKLKELKINVADYGKAKGLNENTTPERFTELLQELEVGNGL